CGDTGVAHVATALAVPSVVIFGPTSPAEWGPPISGPHQALWAGQTGGALAEEPFPGLLEVSVADVLAALADLPQRCQS
ncbi:MAG TPA: glycosyltransferase family 9 protein, partial [Acidimicrobiales bacterium]|nr:glycosyltransferase family 9 protein [Acidimicrobiales bacterium]